MNTGVATIVVNNSGKICMANSKFATLVGREIYEIEDSLNIADFFIDAEKMFPAQHDNKTQRPLPTLREPNFRLF